MALLLSACQPPAQPPGAGSPPGGRTTFLGKYRLQATPLEVPLPLNRVHAWEIRLTDAAGRPVERARFEIDGGMPEHGHGLPTRPEVTREAGDGRYTLDGLKFSMPGRWELAIVVTAAAGEDRVILDAVVDLPPAPGSPAGTAPAR